MTDNGTDNQGDGNGNENGAILPLPFFACFARMPVHVLIPWHVIIDWTGPLTPSGRCVGKTNQGNENGSGNGADNEGSSNGYGNGNGNKGDLNGAGAWASDMVLVFPSTSQTYC